MANIFPRGSNILPLKILLCLLVAGGAVSLAMPYYFTPKYTRVGYQPQQPVTFPHDVHVGQLGMDCRYCHSFVEVAAHSNVPTTQVCMNCHSQVQKENPEACAGAGVVGDGQADRVGAGPQDARLRLFQSLSACESRRLVRELPRPRG